MPRTKATAKKTIRKTTKATTRKVAKKTTKKATTAKRATAAKKVTTAKRATAVKKTIKKKALPTTAIKESLNKSQIYTYISEATDLSKKEIAEVFETLNNLVHRHVKKGATGEFTVPGLLKLVVKSKPAKKARKGVNPFTGEEMTFKAKPASRVIKARALKKLKDMAV
jgi:nucleoid DNA-binding protein